MCFASGVPEDPVALNAELTRAGAILSDGRMDDTETALALGWNNEGKIVFPSDQAIADALRSTMYVIAEVPNHGRRHFVVVTGQQVGQASSTCRFTIADPATNPRSFLDEYIVALSIRRFTR